LSSNGYSFQIKIYGSKPIIERVALILYTKKNVVGGKREITPNGDGSPVEIF